MFHSLACALGFLLSVVLAVQAQGNFSLNIGAAPIPPTPLVQHDDIWRYHLGTNAPQADWKTATDMGLDATWASGPGGFGYGDGDDNTVLTTMSNRFTTVYIRKTFELPAGTDLNRTLSLIMDWDDGFIAWLDGVEIARSPNAPAGEPPHTAISNPPNHNSSAGGGDAPTAYSLGPVGSRLAPGAHVLAVMGLNGSLASSDLSLIADLVLSGSFGGALADGFFALVQTNTVVLSGSNTLAGATRVTVNGLPANYDSIAGTWSRVQTLLPGMNRLFIASLDPQGNILGSISKDIVAELNPASFGGSISADTTWSGSIRVTNNLFITSGATLTVNPGTVVLMSPTAAVRATTNSTLVVAGTRDQPAFFLPADANTAWREVGSVGTNSLMRLSHAEIVAAQVRVQNGATGWIDDSTVRDLTSALEMIEADNGAELAIRRSYFTRFSELDSQNTPVLIEDCLFENFLVDGIDMKTSTGSPLLVRRTTFRYADPNNNNADAIDFGPGAGTVERCLIHHFPDKGVSIGGAPGTQIRDSLFYNCGIGISAYSSTNLVIENSSIADSGFGIQFRNNPQPAIGVASNVIVWGNLTNVAILNTSTLDISSSDIQGTNYPGVGNISEDPQFDAQYRVPPGSPAFGMGARFPVGGIPSAPFQLAALLTSTNGITLSWQEDADNENTFLFERSADGVNWQFLGSTGPNQTTYLDTTAAASQFYFYRARAENSSGVSPWSNIAGGTHEPPTVIVGGTLTQNTTWSPAMGRILVNATVVVPANITLTMLPGTSVTVSNNASIQATAGGIIIIDGTRNSPVTLRPAAPATTWGELSANGNNAALTVRHAEVIGARTSVRNGAAGLMEDSYFHDFRLASCTTLDCPIIVASFASSMVVRRCHFREYYETLFRDGVITIEDCLFEFMSGDALDFDGAQSGTVLRRSTFRHGVRAPSNIDAVDVGPGQLGACRDVIIEDCLMFDFPTDKGVSIGDAPNQAIGTIVRNCLIYDCRSGVQVKDGGFAQVYQCTIVSNRWGFTNYNKVNPSAPTGGGHTTNAYNNILWDNNITISMWNGGTLTADHCNLGNTNWPGEGNINVNPLFVNAAQRDYRLAPNSPCRGAGRDGADMGAQFPVGSIMAPSHPQIQSIRRFDFGVFLTLWADSERTYSIQHAPTLNGPWTKLEDIPAPARPRPIEIIDPLPAHANTENRFYRLVSPIQP